MMIRFPERASLLFFVAAAQVAYIMSDKTGTLTQNKMSFRACTVGGAALGTAQHTHTQAFVQNTNGRGIHQCGSSARLPPLLLAE